MRREGAKVVSHRHDYVQLFADSLAKAVPSTAHIFKGLTPEQIAERRKQIATAPSITSKATSTGGSSRDYRSVFDVPRNNLHAAVAFLDAHWASCAPRTSLPSSSCKMTPQARAPAAEMERHYRRHPSRGVPRSDTVRYCAWAAALPNWFRAIRTRDQKVYGSIAHVS